MDINYDFYSTVDELSEGVSTLEEHADDEGVRFEKFPVILEMLRDAEDRAAYLRREYTTKTPSLEEREKCIQAEDLRSRILGAGVINLLRREYDTWGGDTGIIREEAAKPFIESDIRVTEQYYKIGLEGSTVERIMQDVAQRDMLHFVAPRALSAVGGAIAGVAITAAVRSGGDHIDFTPAQGGMLGLVAPAAIYQLRSLTKRASGQVGKFMRSFSQDSMKKYRYQKPELKNQDEKITELGHRLRYYAERDTKPQREGVHSTLLSYKMRQKEDIVPMVEALTQEHKKMSLASYGITLREGKKAPWYREIAANLTGVDFLG